MKRNREREENGRGERECTVNSLESELHFSSVEKRSDLSPDRWSMTIKNESQRSLLHNYK